MSTSGHRAARVSVLALNQNLKHTLLFHYMIQKKKRKRKKHENSLTIKVFLPGEGTKPTPRGSSQDPWWGAEWTTLPATISQRVWLCSRGSFLWWWATTPDSIPASHSILKPLWGTRVYAGIVFPGVLTAFTIIKIFVIVRSTVIRVTNSSKENALDRSTRAFDFPSALIKKHVL